MIILIIDDNFKGWDTDKITGKSLISFLLIQGTLKLAVFPYARNNSIV